MFYTGEVQAKDLYKEIIQRINYSTRGINSVVEQGIINGH